MEILDNAIKEVTYKYYTDYEQNVNNNKELLTNKTSSEFNEKSKTPNYDILFKAMNEILPNLKNEGIQQSNKNSIDSES